jgi:hypothetical protein
MPVIFASQYVPLVHGAVNWDTQLRTDITSLASIVNGALEQGSGKDLNNFNYQGVYIGATFGNAPLNLADTFLVFVVASVDARAAVQTAHRMTQGNYATYRRYYSVGVGWTAWAAA